MAENNPFAAPLDVEESIRVSVFSTGVAREVVPSAFSVGEVLYFSHRVFMRNVKKCLVGTFLAIFPACFFAGLGPLLFWLFTWGTTVHFSVEGMQSERIPVERISVQGDIFWGPLGWIYLMVSVLGVLMAFWILAGVLRFFTRLVRTGNADYRDIYQATLGEMFRAVVYVFCICLLISAGLAVALMDILRKPEAWGVLLAPGTWRMEFWVSMGIYAALVLFFFSPGFWLLTVREASFAQAFYDSVRMAGRNLVRVTLLAVVYVLFFSITVCLTVGAMAIFALPYLILIYTVSCILASGERLEFARGEG